MCSVVLTYFRAAVFGTTFYVVTLYTLLLIVDYIIFILSSRAYHFYVTIFVIAITSACFLSFELDNGLDGPKPVVDVKGGSNMTGTNCDLFTHR
jgi:hypothetical protein